MTIENFLSLLHNIPEVSFIRRERFEDVHVEIYQGPTNSPIVIDTTDLEVDASIAKANLKNLGVDAFYDDFIVD
jgi:hypothetical protein